MSARDSDLPKIVSIDTLRARRAKKAAQAAPAEGAAEAAVETGKGSHEAAQRPDPRNGGAAAQGGRSPEHAGSVPSSPGYSPRRPSPQEIEELDRVIESLQHELDDVSDVRAEKVIEAKLRMSTGYYGDEKIKLRIIEAMLEAMGTDLTRKAKPAADDDDTPGKGRLGEESGLEIPPGE